MNEHRGSSFVHSCVKVPVDPYSRQPTPLYERPRVNNKQKRYNASGKNRKINFDTSNSNVTSPRDTLENFMDFMESIPDYNDVHHLSNEQFKQKLDYLKRKQRMLLKNLQNCLDQNETENILNREITNETQNQRSNNNKTKEWCNDNNNDLKLKGRKCNFEESRTNSPILYSSGTFDRLAEDQDLLTYRWKDKTKAAKTIHNSKIHSGNKSWSIESDSKSPDSVESDNENSLETKSLPPHSPERWHPTVPKPFTFTLREEAEKYMNLTEVENEAQIYRDTKKKKRRVRPIPLTSKIPLYDKLVAAKEERSRLVREESMLNLLSQVRPFKLECEKRAWKTLSRSSPELCGKKIRCNSRFKAKPVPKNLFNTEIYDRMLEDEYYRSIQKKMRASEMMKSSTLPPSMARRERLRSTSLHSQCSTTKESSIDRNCEGRESLRICNDSPLQLIRSRSALAALPVRGNNLAAVLRCQASREKMEREIQEKLEERRREEFIKIRESLIGQKPAWKALRSAARHEHARDLDFRFHLRRDEAREQAERHRIQMEMMLSRVTQIPTLFERHSQSFQYLQLQSKNEMRDAFQSKKIKLKRRQRPSSVDSFISGGSGSRSNSSSLTSSSGTLVSLTPPSSKSSVSKKSQSSTVRSEASNKKKSERGPLKVSINETAQLIEDRGSTSERFSINSQVSEYHCSANVDNDKL
ncbi:protein FAM161A [Leptopilina boulardi]|uniref:protein FAM161A n=1 Tax=Leptopilina boulardi TaxID=63433 RepID=UPI0021F5F1EA|nr:protein FAM161A [Leptopilina boulardi]